MSYIRTIPKETVLSNTLDEMLAAARPRLLRLAQQQGVTPDAADDVVQDTLVEAWQHLDHLRTPESFDAWLNGICRNVSLRWNRTHSTTRQRQERLSILPEGEQDDFSPASELDIPDPLAIDPAEELSRQDLATLLDRAMSYLPTTTRKALEMHYLAEIPQNETALQLGLTINALEVRLHRARRQLRQVLSNELRSDAESFGMAIDKDMAQGWRDTHIWCLMCGQQKMVGMFEPMPNGEINLRMRCPHCSSLHNFDIVNTYGTVRLGNLRSFRPAIKRAMLEAPQFYKQGLIRRVLPCPDCGTVVKIHGVEQCILPPPFCERFSLVMECPNHGTYEAGILTVIMDHPVVQQFFVDHPRCTFGSEQLVEYGGQEVIQMQIIDVMSASVLIVFVSPRTLEIVNLHLQ